MDAGSTGDMTTIGAAGISIFVGLRICQTIACISQSTITVAAFRTTLAIHLSPVGFIAIVFFF
jgi:hypothetical protein